MIEGIRLETDAGVIANNWRLIRKLAIAYDANLGVPIVDATTVPTTNPSSGGILYSTAGALTWRNSAGTVTTIAPYLPSAHRVKLRKSANQTLTTATLTDLTWDVEDYDTDGYHSGSSATVTIPTGLGGLYLITVSLSYAANTTGQRDIALTYNGTSGFLYHRQQTTSTGGASMPISTAWSLVAAAGDTLVIRGLQNSGGNLDVQASNSQTSVTISLIAT